MGAPEDTRMESGGPNLGGGKAKVEARRRL